MAGEGLSNVAFGQTLASMYPEYGFNGAPTRKELFGDNDPTRFGSGLLVVKGLQDPVSKLIPPFGGNQAKKTIQSATALARGYTESASGKVRHAVANDPYNVFKALTFGQNATKEAQEYFDKDGSVLGDKQSEQFKELPKDQRQDFIKRIEYTRDAKNGGTLGDDTASIKNAAFGSEKGKAYLALTDENQKKEWAKNDSNFRGIYNEDKAFTKAFGSPRLLPDGLSPDDEKTINSYDRRTSTGNKRLFERNPEAKKQYELAHLKERLLAGEIEKEAYEKSLAKLEGRETPKASKTAAAKKARKKTAKKSSGRKGRASKVSISELGKATSIPKIGQIKTPRLSVSKPTAPSYKKPRKVIPKISKAATKFTVRKTNA